MLVEILPTDRDGATDSPRNNAIARAIRRTFRLGYEQVSYANGVATYVPPAEFSYVEADVEDAGNVDRFFLVPRS